MLGYFPTPLADELLYSVCARAFAALRPISRKGFCQILFGANSTAIVDFPGRLKHLEEQLPPNHPITAAGLLSNNTLLPLFLPFLPTDRAQRCRDLSFHGGSKSVQLLTGGTAGGLRPTTCLRLCPACFHEEVCRHGQAYWHRSHQIEGVNFCHLHHAQLVTTKIRRRNRYNRHGFHLPPHDWERDEGTPTDEDVRLAHDAHWLLNENTQTPGLEQLRGIYLRLLVEQGLAHHGGRLRLNRLIEHFLAFHGEEILRRLGCRFRGDSNWLTKLLRPGRLTCAHPVQHLLLIHSLGKSARSLLAEVDRSSTPPESPQIKTIPAKTKSFAPGLLTRLWNNPTISLRAIARRLEVDPMTVKRHAANAGLVFPRQATRPTRSTPPVTPMDRRYRLEYHRKHWLRALAKGTRNPRQHLRTTYSYLFRYDRTWLDAHRPSPTPPSPRKERVSWTERDQELARKVAELQLAGRTPHAIPAELGIGTMLRRHGTRLTETNAMINRGL